VSDRLAPRESDTAVAEADRIAGSDLDVVIFGGGGAGMWLLDVVRRAGHRALLLESRALGFGQTISCQGIIHGGVKYSAWGLVSSSSRVLAEMPRRWRESLEGEGYPNLCGTSLRGDCCHYWGTGSLSSLLSLCGARLNLRVHLTRVRRRARPEVLRPCSGGVFRAPEPVIDPAGFLGLLAEQNSDRILKIDAEAGLTFAQQSSGEVRAVHLRIPGGEREMELRPRWVVLTAGEGNENLRARLGLEPGAMQRRPLHMVMVRGPLPLLNGHCLEKLTTRVTITSTTDSAGRVVWQLGGEIAEKGTRMDSAELIELAKKELRVATRGLTMGDVQWSTYHIDRAEGSTAGQRRPEGAQVLREGNVITAWPTKLALVPPMADKVLRLLGRPATAVSQAATSFAAWPRPAVAVPPWEEMTEWT
jgi:glycerol-3-phosphate dehydrogenase